MRSILTPTEDSMSLTATLGTAFALARRFSSYVEAFHVHPPLGGLMIADSAGAANLIEVFERQDRERAVNGRRRFEEFSRELDVPLVDGQDPPLALDGPSAAWVEFDPPPENEVSLRGACF